MEEPLHCKPQTEDGKKFLDDNAQSESYDSTMEKQAKLFCNADGGPRTVSQTDLRQSILYPCCIITT